MALPPSPLSPSHPHPAHHTLYSRYLGVALFSVLLLVSILVRRHLAPSLLGTPAATAPLPLLRCPNLGARTCHRHMSSRGFNGVVCVLGCAQGYYIYFTVYLPTWTAPEPPVSHWAHLPLGALATGKIALALPAAARKL